MLEIFFIPGFHLQSGIQSIRFGICGDLSFVFFFILLLLLLHGRMFFGEWTFVLRNAVFGIIIRKRYFDVLRGPVEVSCIFRCFLGRGWLALALALFRGVRFARGSFILCGFRAIGLADNLKGSVPGKRKTRNVCRGRFFRVAAESRNGCRWLLLRFLRGFGRTIVVVDWCAAIVFVVFVGGNLLLLGARFFCHFLRFVIACFRFALALFGRALLFGLFGPGSLRIGLLLPGCGGLFVKPGGSVGSFGSVLGSRGSHGRGNILRFGRRFALLGGL
mmetsp:Transcript_24645/g.68043  ORF Transcript_24645/g.68043 Transcript_24645/m.68043 type:complete len:275 (+) Transcript_24645:2114-2938(+)